LIVASLLLILIAVTLLVLGLANGSSQLLVGSIAASLLAAIALVIGARQAAARTAGDEFLGEDDEGDVGEADFARTAARERVAAGAQGPPPWDVPPRDRRTRVGEVPDQRMAAADGVTARSGQGVPGQPPMAAGPPEADEIGDEEDPPGEPAQQQVTPAEAARVARMSTQVLVIDGRPRYHLASCVNLLGRDSEPLPVGEAVELGFTPCSLCEPDTALLTDAHR
jgi:hypothetical protein